MINRYTRPRMGHLWSTEAKYKKWLQIELAHVDVLAEEGQIPKEAAATIQKKAAFGISEIEALEKKVKHDVIAFITNVSEKIGPEGRYLHFGLTSSDVLDTGLALLLKESAQHILDEIKLLMKVLKDRAYDTKDLVTVGRSHGIHAEPTSFGLKFALWYQEMVRNYNRLKKAQQTIAYGKFSGAVGNFAYLTPQIEEKICKKLELNFTPVSTQVIQRDRHAEFFSTLAIIAGTIEKMATEIRHLQRTEVGEVEEPFMEGQKGSSAMPHKKNPILCENLTGLARLVRSYAMASFEDMALWHERDISHSSVERVIAPDSTILVDFMVARIREVLEGLVIHKDTVEANVHKTQGLIFSQRVLLALTQKNIANKNIDRQKAYEWVKEHGLTAWKNKTSFYDLLSNDKRIREYLSEKELKGCFNPKHYLKHVSQIYRRVFECS